MPIEFPENQSELVNRSRTDVQGQLPALNPSLRNSFIDAMVVATSGRNFEFYLQLEALLLEMFPDTATGTFLERWGEYKGVTRNPATQASGNITATGNVGSNILASTQFQTLDGAVYTSDSLVTIAANVSSIVSLTRSGTTVTATTASNHNLASNIEVTIAGAVETEYNVTASVVVTAEDEFTYEITTTPTTPATGTITANYDSVTVPVTSASFGQSANADAGTELTLSTPIVGIDSNAYVQFGALAGGTDIESDEDFRARVLERYREIFALFNAAAIEAQAKTRAGVTRVFVREAGSVLDSVGLSGITRSGNVAIATTSSPHDLESGMQVSIGGADQPEYNVINEIIIVVDDTTFAYPVIGAPVTPATGTIAYIPTVRPGQTVIYFTRDNDENVIPDATEVEQTKETIAEIKPAHMSLIDLIVRAPEAVVVDFSFSSLSPNTSTMQAAITANLQAFFEEETDVGEDVTADDYRCVINSTIDPATGTSPTGFTLTTPTGTISVADNELPVLGNVTYP